MNLRNRLNHFRARSKRLALKPNAENFKFMPNDNSRHVQLRSLESKNNSKNKNVKIMNYKDSKTKIK